MAAHSGYGGVGEDEVPQRKQRIAQLDTITWRGLREGQQETYKSIFYCYLWSRLSSLDLAPVLPFLALVMISK